MIRSSRFGYLVDYETGPCWLRFRRRGDQLVAYLHSGLVVLIDADSPLKPVKPGHYFAISIHDCGKVAFAVLSEAHRNLKFSREETFGRSEDGRSFLLAVNRGKYKKLPFVCDPAAEKLEIFGFSFCRLRYASGKVENHAFRNGKWRIIASQGPHKMSDADYQDASRRVMAFARGNRELALSDASAAREWAAALEAGVVTPEEESEASRRHGSSWNYSGS